MSKACWTMRTAMSCGRGEWRGGNCRGGGGGYLQNNVGVYLLSVVATLHHDGVGETLDDRALRLAEALLLPPAGRVREEGHGLDKESGIKRNRNDETATASEKIDAGQRLACLSMAM
jgi:hypothetical protein